MAPREAAAEAAFNLPSQKYGIPVSEPWGNMSFLFCK